LQRISSTSRSEICLKEVADATIAVSSPRGIPKEKTRSHLMDIFNPIESFSPTAQVELLDIF